MVFRKILVPTDLSEESEVAFEPAIELARASGGSIVLASIVQEAVNLRMAVLSNAAAVSPEIDQVAEGLVKTTGEKLEQRAEAIRKRGVEVKTAAIEGL